MNLNKKEFWSFTHAGLYVSIVNWGKERGEFEPMNHGHGVWNYYVTLPERLLGEKFKEVWLEDKRFKFTPNSPEQINHDYYGHPFSDVDWHGGITYYAKHGQLEGHRNVELGCDYNHLWDSERGYNYTLEEVVADAKKTAEELAAIYLPQPK
jgi:hypothetical protein